MVPVVASIFEPLFSTLFCLIAGVQILPGINKIKKFIIFIKEL